MSANSSFLNSSPPIPFIENMMSCMTSTRAVAVFFSFAASNFFCLFPVSTLVVYFGLQNRRQQRPAASHADLFTYHMVALEVVGLMGSTWYCFGSYFNHRPVMAIGFFLFSLIFPGQTLFHCLTCVERYLAVVHPVAYLGLKNEGGARIRNISIGCTWLACLAWLGVMILYFPFYAAIPFFFVCTSSLFVTCFCSVSVLRALTRPAPGEVGGASGARGNRAKRKAFYTIMAIMGTLLFRFAGILICFVLFSYLRQVGGDACLVINSMYWFCFPSSLVLPLLFLHRREKLACCLCNTESA